MTYRTKEECIKLFNTYLNQDRYIAIKGLEFLSEWKLASDCWKILGYDEDSKACLLIYEAIQEGDRIRNETFRT